MKVEIAKQHVRTTRVRQLPDLRHYADSYQYDLAGNRLQKTHDAGNDATIDETIAYVFDNNDRLLTETKDVAGGTAGDTTTAYEYGGPTNPGTEQTKKTVTDTATSVVRSSTSFTYDLQGRMEQVTVDTFDAAGTKTRTERTTFDYDDAGWRVSTLQEIDADADGTFETRTQTEFLADKSNFTGYAQTLQEVVTNADTGAEIKRTVYTIGLDVIAQTVFTPGGPAERETHVFLYDGHGSVRALADMLAAVVETYNFDAYGNAFGFNPATALTSLLYSGEHFNPAIGQQYLRARWYDAMTGRFNRVDPFAGMSDDPQSLHKYLYANADPSNRIDPSGEISMSGMVSALSIGSALVALGGGTYLGVKAGKPVRGAVAGGVLGAAIIIARTKGIKALG